ncbi:efflux RND transporter permease subunit [Leptospira meyeri]|uniref:efflux RND transporter permease subunit n=1 Tax=Leptospira meyeri TaxID=29508 RepID=UPI000C29C8A2|nr:efflux RND transporter permease subunit [Leptospira meyeri]PJZ82139.1 heavy metal RND transporter permease [Leptospira meyeri]PJZ97643.1 heavy metal RND transporter permease [Leptospira meyeri]
MKIESYILSLYKHKKLYFVICLSIVIAAFFRIPELEIWLLPKLTPSRYFVVTEYPNHSAEDTDMMVSLPISEMISAVKSVDRIRTISEHSKSIVEIDLQFGASIRDFKEELYQTILEMKDKLPLGVGISRLVQGEISDRPFLEIIIPNETIDSLKNFQFRLKQLVFQLERIPGVTEVRVIGNRNKISIISINPQTFDLFPINIRDLELQLQAGIRHGSLGVVEEYRKETELKFSPEVLSHQNLFEFPIHLGNGSSVGLGRLATIYEADSPGEKLTRLNGKNSVYLAVFTDPFSNPLRLSSEVKTKLRSLDSVIHPEIFYDGSNELEDQINQSSFNMIWGLGFAFLFSFLLYRSWVPAMILLISVLFSLVFFFHLILFFSISINLLSLGGISVGIGMLFDASNLIVFSIRKNLIMGLSNLEAVTKGIRSVLVSLVSSSLTTIVVFIPLLLFPMKWKEFFFDSGVCIALLVFCSLVSSVLIVPMLSISLAESLKLEPNRFEREESIFAIYNKTYFLFSKMNVRLVTFIFIIISSLYLLGFGPSWKIFPEQVSVGNRLQLIPWNHLSLEEELLFVETLEKKIKTLDPSISIFLSPLNVYDTRNQHPKKAIAIEWKFFGTKNEKELERLISDELLESRWDWQWGPINSQLKTALPFIPVDSVVFLHDQWEELNKIVRNFQTQSKSNGFVGKFDFLPKEIRIEEWTRNQIPSPDWNPNEEDLKQKFSYQQIPKYIGTIGETNKSDLYLGFDSFLSNHTNANDISKISFKTKTNDTTFLSSLFRSKPRGSWNQFRRESGLFSVEWVGQVVDFDLKKLDPKGHLSLLKVSASEEIKKFYLVLAILLLISFVFIYLALVGIYESFWIPFFYLSISCIYILVTIVFVFCFFSEFHLGHYIGLVVLLGLSIDSISLFAERWIEVPKNVMGSEKREYVLRWLFRPILLNTGTTMMGLFPVILFGGHGSDYSESIASTMFVGIFLSLFFVFYVYPTLFVKFWDHKL